MALPITIPYTFANATSSIPLSNLDTDFTTVANAINGIGNGTVALSNVVITGGIISNVSGLSTSSIANGTSNVSIATANGSVTVATAGTTAMTIDTSQNVGIGTVSPSQKLDVNGTILAGKSGTSVGYIGLLSGTSVNTGYAAFYNAAGTRQAYIGYIGSPNNALNIETDSGSNLPIRFGTNATEAMRIDSSQNLLVGTTNNSNSSKTVFAGSATASSGVNSVAEFQGGGSGANGGQIRLLNTYSTATSPSKWLRVNNNGSLDVVNNAYNAVLLTLDDSGNFQILGATATKASGTTWANPSDIRLKDNVADYTKGLSELLKIRVCSWTYNGKGGTTAGLQSIGVVADEIATVLPDTVREYQAKLNSDDETETAIKQFDASEVIWLLVKSAQELSAKNDALEARLAKLENAQ